MALTHSEQPAIVKIAIKTIVSMLVSKLTFSDLLTGVMVPVMKEEQLGQLVHNDWDSLCVGRVVSRVVLCRGLVLTFVGHPPLSCVPAVQLN